MSTQNEQIPGNSSENKNVDEGTLFAQERTAVEVDPAARNKTAVEGTFYAEERTAVEVDPAARNKTAVEGTFYAEERTAVEVDPAARNKTAVEGTFFAEERVAVDTDSKSVRDDASDYIFLKPKRSRHHSDSHSSGTVKRVHRKKKMKKWKKSLIGVACGLLAFILVVTGVVFFLVLRGQNELFTDKYNLTAPKWAQVSDGGKYVTYNGHTYRFNEKVTSILLMGIDKSKLENYGNTESQGQADVIVMMAYDTKNKKITLINIPRDLMTDVPIYSPDGVYTSTKRQQICLAYAYGDGKDKSCENMVTVTGRLFYNLPIKTYFALDIAGVSKLNDSIGGVDVVSPETIEKFIKGEKYHLMGDDARRFVEAREHETAEANLKRNERQKVYATSFMNNMLSAAKKDISAPVNVFNASAPYSNTNLTPTKVSFLAKEIVLGGSPKNEIVSVDGTTKLNGDLAEFTLKEKEFYELFLRVYYEQIN